MDMKADQRQETKEVNWIISGQKLLTNSESNVLQLRVYTNLW